MQKETIPARQMLCIIIMYIFGSSIIMGVSTDVAQDSWISLLMAWAFAVPIFLIYARIIKLFPEKDLFEIIEILFGQIAGKLIILLITWYALHLCALVLRNFSEFIQVATMPETPQLPIMISMILVVVYMAKSGIVTMGKWSIVALIIIIFIIFLTILLSLNNMDFTNILPVMEHSLKELSTGAFNLFAFPFAETVLFLCLANSIKKSDSPYKVYLLASLLSTVFLLLIMLRNLFTLGLGLVNSSYFVSYEAVKLIKVADFLSRVEGSISMNFILAGIIKITVCLMAASKGTARLFGIKNYRQILLPVSLLVIALSSIVYKSIMEMFDFLRFYTYYAIPFEIVIPMAVWIAAEIKMRKKKLA